MKKYVKIQGHNMQKDVKINIPGFSTQNSKAKTYQKNDLLPPLLRDPLFRVLGLLFWVCCFVLERCTNPRCEAGKQWIFADFHNMPVALLIFNDFQAK